jgi:IPT/TIG domain
MDYPFIFSPQLKELSMSLPSFVPRWHAIPKRGFAVTALATLLLSACLGGGGGLSGGAGGTQVNVAPALGKFELGATVRVKDKNGRQFTTGTVGANGLASLTIPSGTLFPVLIEAGLPNEKYYDERSQGLVAVSGVGVSGVAVRALVPDLASLTAGGKVGVTALTEIAVGTLTNAQGVLPASLSIASAVAANTSIAQSFSVSSVLVAPTLVGSAADLAGLTSSAADQYALRLAALANLSGVGVGAVTGEDALMVTHRLRDDLKLATPQQNLTAVVTALNTAIGNLNTATNAPKVLLPVPATTLTLPDLITAASYAIQAMNTALSGLTTAPNAAALLTAGEAAAAKNLADFWANGGALAVAAFNTGNAALTTLINGQVAANSPPVISSFSPTSGAAGTTVTLTGSNFDGFFGHNLVKFGGVQATVTAGTTTSLTFTVPTGATTGALTVSNIADFAHPKNVTSSGVFTVLASTANTTCPAGQTLNPLMQCVATGTVGGNNTGFVTTCIANTFSHGVTTAQLSPFVRSYAANLYANNLPGTAAGAAVTLGVAADGGISYNGVVQRVTSICQDNVNAAQIYVQFLGGGTLSGLDFFTDGGVTGNLADANVTMVQGGSCSTAAGCGTGVVTGGATGTGITLSVAQGGVSTIANTTPSVSNTAGMTIQSYAGGVTLSYRLNTGVEEFNLSVLSKGLNNGGFTAAPGSCALAANTLGAPVCSSLGITFNKAAGTVSFVNTPIGTGLYGTAPTVFNVSGSLTFTPF